MQQQEATITTLEDQVKRQMAEFDNFRKRTERKKTDMFDLGAIDVVKKLLQSLITLREVSKLYLKVKKQQDLLREWRWFTSR